jgi:hypothetical protein
VLLNYRRRLSGNNIPWVALIISRLPFFFEKHKGKTNISELSLLRDEIWVSKFYKLKSLVGKSKSWIFFHQKY